jgi:membrane dipeptidase
VREALMQRLAQDLMHSTVVWDNHACMPLRFEDSSFLPQLARHRESGVSVVSLNVYMDRFPLEVAFLMLAAFRAWIEAHATPIRWHAQLKISGVPSSK